ncbi:hypothetical protein BDN67DRAFT_982063 [Paxillus ammoniavirescens]|nr:hypothetical protein BDN67DRAFT_982063 [Paxillus ammoniavirescens]
MATGLPKSLLQRKKSSPPQLSLLHRQLAWMYSQRRPSGAPTPAPMSGNQPSYNVNHETPDNPYQNIYPSGKKHLSPLDLDHENQSLGIPDDVFTSHRPGGQLHKSQRPGVLNGGFSFQQSLQDTMGPQSPRLSPDAERQAYLYHGHGNGQTGTTNSNLGSGFQNTSQANSTPHLANRGRMGTPFLFNNELSSSRSGSVGMHDVTPFDDCQSSHSSSQSQSRPPTYLQMNGPLRGYQHGSTGSLDMYPREPHDPIISQLIGEVKRLREAMNQQTAANEDLKQSNERLHKRLQSAEDEIFAVRQDISQMEHDAKRTTKSAGSNEHPSLKVSDIT